MTARTRDSQPAATSGADELVELVRELPVPRIDAARMERVRTVLLASVKAEPVRRRRALPLRAWLLVAAAVAVAGGGFAASRLASSRGDVQPGEAPAPIATAPAGTSSAATPVSSASTAPSEAEREVDDAPAERVDGPSSPASLGPTTTATSDPSRAPAPVAVARALPPPAAAPAASAPRGVDPGEAAFAEGWKALDRGESAAAEKMFQRAEREGKGQLGEDAAFWRAVAMARAGDRKSAIAAFESFLARYPSSPRRGEASALLGRLLLDAGDKREAARRFEAASTDPSPGVRDAARRGREAAEAGAQQR